MLTQEAYILGEHNSIYQPNKRSSNKFNTVKMPKNCFSFIFAFFFAIWIDRGKMSRDVTQTKTQRIHHEVKLFWMAWCVKTLAEKFQNLQKFTALLSLFLHYTFRTIDFLIACNSNNSFSFFFIRGANIEIWSKERNCHQLDITQSISLLWRHFQGDVNIITADIKIEGNIIFIMNLTYICSHKINK